MIFAITCRRGYAIAQRRAQGLRCKHREESGQERLDSGTRRGERVAMTEDLAGGPPREALETDVPTLVPGTSDRSGPGPHRRLLGRDQILREAVRLIDEEGRDRLTMRRLGSELGVEAMALYRYIPGREQLLDGVVEYVMNELYQKTMTTRSCPAPGRSTCSRWRTAYATSPSPIPASSRWSRPGRRPRPWLRPPLRSLRWVEGFLVLAAALRLHRREERGRSIAPSRRSCSATCCWSRPRSTSGRRTELDDDIEFFETNDLSQYPAADGPGRPAVA